MFFGEKTADRQINVASRKWSLGDLQLSEKDVWKNLAKISHVKANDMFWLMLWLTEKIKVDHEAADFHEDTKYLRCFFSLLALFV